MNRSNFITIWQNDNILLDELMLHIFLRNKINSDITIKLLDKLEKKKHYNLWKFQLNFVRKSFYK